MPMLSIIIPVYNQTRYLQECMDSVLTQRFTDFEVIAVDDGSTDDSLDILKHYAQQDHRIKIIAKDNGGYGTAMNAGLREACGIYIGIVEPDDVILPHMYEELITTAVCTNADIVRCSFIKFFSGNLKMEETEWYDVAGTLFTLEEKPEICRLHPSIWAAVYKREFINKNHITFSETPGATYQDVPFFAGAYSAAESIYVIAKALYKHRLESSNQFSSTNAIGKNSFYRFENHKKAKAIYLRRGIWEKVKYAELQREFITLNNFTLRIGSPLRKKMYQEIHDYFSDLPLNEAKKFLPPNFQYSFKLIRNGNYFSWLLRYAFIRILAIRTAAFLGIIDLVRWLYLTRKRCTQDPLC